jgi:hypothetical protein
MRLDHALKLKRGDYVCYGDHWLGKKCHDTYEAEVLKVTDKGGILVRGTSGSEHWIPYHHVIHTDGHIWWDTDFRPDDLIIKPIEPLKVGPTTLFNAEQVREIEAAWLLHGRNPNVVNPAKIGSGVPVGPLPKCPVEVVS